MWKKKISVICHINRMKEKKSQMINLIEVEKAFHKIENPFMIKTEKQTKKTHLEFPSWLSG